MNIVEVSKLNKQTPEYNERHQVIQNILSTQVFRWQSPNTSNVDKKYAEKLERVLIFFFTFDHRMKKHSILTLIGCFLVLCSMAQQKYIPVPEGKYFKPGERLELSINYGWFKLGEAVATLDEQRNAIKGKDHYSFDLKAETVGFLSFIKSLEAHFHSYLLTSNYKPTHSENKIIEGKERWDQRNFFDYKTNKVDINIHTNKPPNFDRHHVLDLKRDTYDILGTVMYLRNINWSKLNVGDSIMISTLYDSRIYDFGIESGGTEKMEFQGKTYNAHKLYILFPISKTFPEPHLVIFWLIDMKGVHLPILIEANMRIGRVLCKLEKYEQL